MSDCYEQDCPLCASIARYRLRYFDRVKHFSCNNCTEFITFIPAENRLATAPDLLLTQLSEMAKKSNTERILVISLSTQGQHDRSQGFAGEVFCKVFESRSDWEKE